MEYAGKEFTSWVEDMEPIEAWSVDEIDVRCAERGFRREEWAEADERYH